MTFNPETHVSEHFTIAEMQCKGTGDLRIQDGFLELLEDLRARLAQPMTITSGCRAPAHNDAVGGHPKSLHLTANPWHDCNTLAVDVKRTSGVFHHALITTAAPLGWSIGVAKHFIHLDARKQLLGMTPQSWGY